MRRNYNARKLKRKDTLLLIPKEIFTNVKKRVKKKRRKEKLMLVVYLICCLLKEIE